MTSAPSTTARAATADQPLVPAFEQPGFHEITVGRSGRLLSYAVPAVDADHAFELARNCARRYSSAQEPAFLAEAAVLAHELSQPIRRACNLARLNERTHAVVLANAVRALDLVGDTPGHWRAAEPSDSPAHSYLLALYASLFGDLIGWLTQQDGRVVTDVLPIPGFETSEVSSSSAKELGWHTEDAFSDARADYVALMCLRSREPVPTTLSYLEPQALAPQVLEVLHQKRFLIRPDTSHQATPTTTGETEQQAADRIERRRVEPPRVAVLSGHPDAPTLRIDRDFTAAPDDDPVAADALAAVIAHLDDNIYELPLRPGDIAIIDNRNAVHGRRPFRAYYDGKDRWLKRVNIITDLRRARPSRADSTTRLIG
ncbi:MAG: guanitoxin biosynthesis L-enduracididine beta-hydroxylase GntD [Jatrophihabitans sp.]